MENLNKIEIVEWGVSIEGKPYSIPTSGVPTMLDYAHKKLAYTYGKKVVAVYDLTKEERIFEVVFDVKNDSSRVSIFEDKIALSNGTIEVYDLKENKKIFEIFRVHHISSINFNDDGSKIEWKEGTTHVSFDLKAHEFHEIEEKVPEKKNWFSFW